MKKISIITLSLLLIISLFAGCSEKTFETPTGMSKASNDAAGYTMFVPDSWTINESSGITSASAGIDTMTTVSGAKVSRGDAADADAYFKSYEEELKSVMPDFAIQGEAENVLVGQLGARRYTYTGTVSGTLRTYSMVLCASGDHIYILTLTTTSEEYDEYISHFEKICTEFIVG